MNLSEHLEVLEDLHHDLGKYICFESRFVEENASNVELRTALCTDVFETRRGPDGVLTAWQVWERLRPPELADREEIRTIERSLLRLSELNLLDDNAPRSVLLEARALCQVVATNTRTLLKVARGVGHG